MTEVIHSENEYDDLLGQWADLESGLGVILSNPANAREFVRRVHQYARWMQDLLVRDADVGLYLLFQLAGNSPVGYSASHSLVCATLCHLLGTAMEVVPDERDSLVHAALTMNIGMTSLQDQLANQVEKPSREQQDAIRSHSAKGALMLSNMGIGDEMWLDIVASHHDEGLETHDPRLVHPATRLAGILKVVDRYAAMISPRMSRAGRTASESARSIMANTSAKSDAVAHALVNIIGMCPPGTFVRMDDDELAVVLRRSSKPNLPYVALLGDANGELLPSPRLHGTAHSPPAIRAALAASAIRANINHFRILQLSVLT